MYSKRNKLIKRTVIAGSIAVIKRTVVPDEFGVDRIVTSTVDIHAADVELPEPSVFNLDNSIRTGKNLDLVSSIIPKTDPIDFEDKHGQRISNIIDKSNETTE